MPSSPRSSIRQLGQRLLTVAALSLMVIGMGGASCLIDIGVLEAEDAGVLVGDGGTEADTDACQEGAICTPGCLASGINSAEGSACAECVDDSGDAISICGEIVSIPCFTVESPFGVTCQQCFSDDGEYSFNNCDESQDAFVEVVCRDVETETVNEDGELDVETCEICTDEGGRVVSRTCRPEADSCETVIDNGLECEVCTLGGEFAYRECQPLIFEPRVCETYGNDDERCFDCYGDQDELLVHYCEGPNVPAIEGSIACDEYVNFEGEYCEVCFNTATGEIVNEACEGEGNPSERCEVLFFDSAECTVCSIDGDVTSADCFGYCEGTGEDPDGPPGNAPPDPDFPNECPAECDLSRIDGDTVCVACFDLNTGDFQEQCTSGGEGDLLCEIIYDTVSDDPNDPGLMPAEECFEDADCNRNAICIDQVCVPEGEPPPVVTDYECLVCYDPETEEEVYRACEPIGQPQQPECYVENDAAGNPCEVCFDPETGDIFFDSCDDEPPPPPQCLELELPLLRADRDIYLTNVDGTSPAYDPNGTEIIAFCQECYGDGFEDGFAECNVFGTCDAFALDCGQNGLVRIAIAPTACDAPWGRDFDGDPDELARILGWAWEDVGVRAVEVVRLGQYETDDCNSPRGDTIILTVPENALEQFAAFDFEFFDDAP